MQKFIFLLWTFLSLSAITFADVGETFELKRQRETALINAKDSGQIKLNELDKQIFQSYEETINRLENGERELESKQSSLVLVCCLALLLLTISVYMLYVLNSKLNQNGIQNQNLYTTISELFTSLLFLGIPSKSALEKSRGIHFILFLCLIGMLISMIGYLINII